MYPSLIFLVGIVLIIGVFIFVFDWDEDSLRNKVVNYKIVSNGKGYKVQKLTKGFLGTKWRDHGNFYGGLCDYSHSFKPIIFDNKEVAQGAIDLLIKKEKEDKEERDKIKDTDIADNVGWTECKKDV